MSLETKQFPDVGDTYIDFNNRILIVEKISIGNYLGREVRGLIRKKSIDKYRSYSCSIDIWRDIWRDKAIPADPSTMKI